MQFTTNEKVGNPTKVATFEFFDKLNQDATGAFVNVFEKLGGTIKDSINHWDFPTHVSNETIAQVIRNTCFVCGGIMKDSTAFQNSNVSFTDFGDDAGSKGTTQSKVGPAQQIKVRKCTACGHSHT